MKWPQRHEVYQQETPYHKNNKWLKIYGGKKDFTLQELCQKRQFNLPMVMTLPLFKVPEKSHS